MGNQADILIIDDDQSTVSLLKSALEGKGYHTTSASNGAEGLEKLKIYKPDLIILDINMPVMGGIEFYRQICDKQNKAKYPILVVTSRENLESLFKELEVDGFVPKPFNINRLLKEVEIIMGGEIKNVEKKQAADFHDSRKLCIVENDPEVFTKLAVKLLNADYTIYSAKSGLMAVNKITSDLPDMVLIKLGLSDLPGDLVIAKLKKMSKTESVRFILYCSKEENRSESILKQKAENCGIDRIIEYTDTDELFEVVNFEFRNIVDSVS